VADNVDFQSATLATPASATKVATDQLAGGEHVQYVKLMDGTLDGSGKVAGDAANGLDVDVTRVSGVVHVDDNAGSLTVDGTVTAAAQPGVDIGDVTVNNASGASAVNIQDGGNIISVDDGAGSLTVDGTVTANAGTGVFHVDDNAGSLTVDGTVTANQGTANATPWNENLAQVGGVAIATKAGGTFGQTAIPVWPNAVQRDTYYVVVNGLAVAFTAGGGDKTILSLEHAAGATKTVRVRRILLSGVVTTASAAVAGNLTFKLFTGTAASSAGTTVTPAKANQASGAAEVVAKTAPTITAAGGPNLSLITLGTGAGGAVLGTQIAQGIPMVIYDWQENGETVPMTLRSGNLESLLLVGNGTWATTAPTITFGIQVILTEE